MKNYLRAIAFAFVVIGLGVLGSNTASASCATVTGYKFYDQNRAIQILYTTDVPQKLTIPDSQGGHTFLDPVLGNTNIAFQLPPNGGDVIFEDPDGCKTYYPLPLPYPAGGSTAPVAVTAFYFNATLSSATVSISVNPGAATSLTTGPWNFERSEIMVLPSPSGNSITVNLDTGDGSAVCESSIANSEGISSGSSYIYIVATNMGWQGPACSIFHNP